MNPSISISVILPTFNRGHRLAYSIGSLFEQTISDWELIIVDDGSKDDTQIIANEIINDGDGRVSYLYQKNQGPAIARNTGAENAKGKIIVYLDSDDRLYPSALDDILWTCKDETALYGLTNHNRTIQIVDKSGKEISRKFDSSGINKDVTLEHIYNWEIKTTSSGLFHRKSLFDEGIHWRPGFWIEDLDFLLQLAVKAPMGFRHIPKVLVDYVQTYGGDGLCSNATYADWAHAFKSIYEFHKNDPLMKNPDIYLQRISKYETLHAKFLAGQEPPPQYKYFLHMYGKSG